MIIVTGASGFIGSTLIEYLNLLGSGNIWAIDRHISTNLLGLNVARFSTVDDFERLLDCDPTEVMRSIRQIYHLGAISATTETDQAALDRYNIGFSARLIDSAAYHRVPLAFASSASVYGTPPQIGRFIETQPLYPASPYARSKMATEGHILQSMLMGDGAKSTLQAWRLFNVYGAREGLKGNMASPVYRFSEQAQTGYIEVFKGSDFLRRDFIWAGDVVKTMVHGLQERPEVSGIFNLGTGRSRSFQEIANLVQRVTPRQVWIREIPFPRHIKPHYQSFTEADMRKTTAVFGVDPAAFMTPEDLLTGRAEVR